MMCSNKLSLAKYKIYVKKIVIILVNKKTMVTARIREEQYKENIILYIFTNQKFSK